jgi:hypothetical protein
MKPAKIAKRLRVDKPKQFRLADYDPADTLGLDIDKDEGKGILARDIDRLAELQDRFYPQHRWALLIVLQGFGCQARDVRRQSAGCRGALLRSAKQRGARA